MTGAGQLGQNAIAIEPEIFAENVLVPIGAFSADDHRLPVRESFTAGKSTASKNSSNAGLGLSAANAGKQVRTSRTNNFRIVMEFL